MEKTGPHRSPIVSANLQANDGVTVRTWDLSLPAREFSSGWQTALARPPRLQIANLLPPPGLPGVASLRLDTAKVKVFGFKFPDVGAVKLAKQPATAEHAAPKIAALPPSADNPAAESRRATRIKPPTDAIKLEDRLYYLLQPSLESLIRDGSLTFPFRPFPYQFEGVAFLYPRYVALLADEMGLGKTMQAITSIRLLLHSGEIKNTLLICPKPLVTNWQREFALWAPELPLAVIEGEQAKRRWQWRLPDKPVKIANYELLHRDLAAIADPSLHFDLVILDEAQRIKNRSSNTSQAVRSIARRRSWALTGTPVENHAEDLLGIFEFLAPGYLSAEMKPRRMGQAVHEYVLRRTKDQVLTELPPKMFREAEIDLTAEQRQTYQLAEDEGVLRLSELGKEATIQHVFELVLRLKQICNFDPATGQSAKLERLTADLEEVVASGRKALVFSQWVSTLDTLAERLARFRPLSYHGKVPQAKRDGIIEQFRNEPGRHLMLVSYGAGGVGLNLQFAGYVFLFDRWWNPAVEDQAINRAHRIGAAGPVTVTRFLARETIEQRIDQVLRDKRELFDTIFSERQTPRSVGLTHQEIFGLFKLRCPTGPIELADHDLVDGANLPNEAA